MKLNIAHLFFCGIVVASSLLAGCRQKEKPQQQVVFSIASGSTDTIEKTIAVLTQRLQLAGIKKPVVKKLPDGAFSINAPKNLRKESLLHLFQAKGMLHFQEAFADPEYGILQASLPPDMLQYLNLYHHSNPLGPLQFQVPFEDTTAFMKKVTAYLEKNNPAQIQFRYGRSSAGEDRMPFAFFYVLKGPAEGLGFQRSYIKKATSEKAADKYIPVTLQFSDAGSKWFETLTEAMTAYRYGYLAILFDNFVVTCPKVMAKISGGTANILGWAKDAAEAEIFTMVLNVQPLPAAVRVEKTEFEPDNKR